MKHLLLCTFSCIHLFSQAQLVWSETATRLRKEPDLVRIVKGKDDEIITISFRNNPFTFYKPITPVATRLDKDLQPVLEKELFTTGENVHFHSAWNFREHVYLFTTWYNRPAKKTLLYCTEIDPVSLHVLWQREVAYFDAIRGWRHLEFEIKASEDTSHILIFTNSSYPQREPARMLVQVLDHRMNNDWGKRIKLPHAGKYVQVKSVDVSNSGEVYVLYKHYKNDMVRERVQGQPGYAFKLLKYGREEREYDLAVQNKFIHDIALQLDANGKVFLTGLYRDDYWRRVKGHFMTGLNEVARLDTFPYALLKDLKTDRSATTKPPRAGISNNFRVMGTNIRSDGSVDMLTEENYSYEDSDSSHSDMIYVANDIVVVNFKTDGSMQYTRIPKSQSEHNSNTYISFKWMKHGDDLLLFYNDNKENVDRELEKRPYTMYDVRRSVLVKATVNNRGELMREAVYDNKEMDLVTMIKNSEVFNHQALILYAERNRLFQKQRIRFGRLVLSGN